MKSTIPLLLVTSNVLIVTDATKSFLDHGLLGACPDAAAPRGLYIVAARAHKVGSPITSLIRRQTQKGENSDTNN